MSAVICVAPCTITTSGILEVGTTRTESLSNPILSNFLPQYLLGKITICCDESGVLRRGGGEDLGAYHIEDTKKRALVIIDCTRMQKSARYQTNQTLTGLTYCALP